MNIQHADLDDTIKGILFFLGKLEFKRKPSFDLGLVSNFVSGTSILTDLKHGSEIRINRTGSSRKIIEGYQRHIKPIRELFKSFFNKLTDKIFEIYGESTEALEWVEEFGIWAISTLSGSLANLIPGWGYIQNAIDLYEDVKKSVKIAINWLGRVFSGWGVQLLKGEPSIIAEAIARHNATSLSGGLKDISITYVKKGLQSDGDSVGGAVTIVGAITGVLQRIANMLGYAVQRFFVNRTISQAKHQWNTKGDMLQNRQQFNQWFKKSVVCTPIIAALTLNSGYAANPMRFLSLINDDGDIVSQKEYEKGVTHIEKLKDLSRAYIIEYTDCYKLDITAPESETVNNTLKNLLA